MSLPFAFGLFGIVAGFAQLYVLTRLADTMPKDVQGTQKARIFRLVGWADVVILPVVFYVLGVFAIDAKPIH